MGVTERANSGYVDISRLHSKLDERREFWEAKETCPGMIIEAAPKYTGIRRTTPQRRNIYRQLLGGSINGHDRLFGISREFRLTAGIVSLLAGQPYQEGDVARLVSYVGDMQTNHTTAHNPRTVYLLAKQYAEHADLIILDLELKPLPGKTSQTGLDVITALEGEGIATPVAVISSDISNYHTALERAHVVSGDLINDPSTEPASLAQVLRALALKSGELTSGQ